MDACNAVWSDCRAGKIAKAMSDAVRVAVDDRAAQLVFDEVCVNNEWQTRDATAGATGKAQLEVLCLG